MGALGCVCMCILYSMCVWKCMFVCTHVWVCVCVWHPGICVWVSVCTGWWGLGVLCRILDKVGALPKDGWRSFFSEHIVKNTYIPPRNQVCTGFRFSCFWMEAGIGGKNGIVDQLDFTLLLLLSQVWPTQQLWWMSHLQEYITNSKTVPALNSKVYSLLQRWWKNSCRQWGPFFFPPFPDFQANFNKTMLSLNLLSIHGQSVPFSNTWKG